MRSKFNFGWKMQVFLWAILNTVWRRKFLWKIHSIDKREWWYQVERKPRLLSPVFWLMIILVPIFTAVSCSWRRGIKCVPEEIIDLDLCREFLSEVYSPEHIEIPKGFFIPFVTYVTMSRSLKHIEEERKAREAMLRQRLEDDDDWYDE